MRAAQLGPCVLWLTAALKLLPQSPELAALQIEKVAPIGLNIAGQRDGGDIVPFSIRIAIMAWLPPLR